MKNDFSLVLWGSIALVFVISLLSAAFGCWLRHLGIRPFVDVRSFLRRPWCEVLVVLLCVGGFVRYGASKGLLGGFLWVPPLAERECLTTELEVRDDVDGMFPAYTNAAQNVSRHLRKGNAYRLSMRWLNCDGHTDPYNWYCWQAKIDDRPSSSSYLGYSTERLARNEIVVGSGWIAENADGLLSGHVHMHDPDENGYGGGNVAKDLKSTLFVYDVAVSVCKPEDDNWNELEASRVLLDTENLRLKIKVTPAIDSLELCRQALGNSVVVKTSGTRPAGVSVPIDSSATFLKFPSYSEIRISKTRDELKTLGLVPSNDDDGVNEMAWMDMAATPGQTLADSEAFATLGYEDRGTASTLDPSRTLDSVPPNAVPSESYFKAAGREIVTAFYGGTTSARRQIMNQADIFYYSGHGDHATGGIQGGFTPAMARDMWNRDLDCVIIAACSVFDINDYNGNYKGPAHGVSPGKEWEKARPAILLGYNYIAPGDKGGNPEKIVRSWLANRGTMGDVNAWINANCEHHAWNACAIVKDEKYVYVKLRFFGRHRKITSVKKEDW